MAATTDKVLRDEANTIHGAKFTPDVAGPTLYLALGNLASTALSISGGGIRSAAFGLGVIQALARHPRPTLSPDAQMNQADRSDDSLLAQFHYLSTVSGGGYIGGWLSAWRLTCPYSEIWANLTGRPNSPDKEAAAIGWVRSYNSTFVGGLSFHGYLGYCVEDSEYQPLFFAYDLPQPARSCVPWSVPSENS